MKQYYFNARWYDAGLGRFVTEDPARDGANWYAYCSNNPLVFVDLTGFEDENFQFSYTDKLTYFDIFEGSVILAPVEAIANVGRYTGNVAINITNKITGIVNLGLSLLQDPVVTVENVTNATGEYIDSVIEDAKTLTPQRAVDDLKTIATDISTWEEFGAQFTIAGLLYGAQQVSNKGNGIGGKNFDTDPVAETANPAATNASGDAGTGMENFVPTVNELRAFNPSGSGLQTHHLLPEYLGKQLGYTSSQMANQPGILIPQFAHTGALNPIAFHKVISSYLPVGGNYTATQISQGLGAAYTELGMSELFNVIEPLIK